MEWELVNYSSTALQRVFLNTKCVCIEQPQNLQSITFNIGVIGWCIKDTKIHFPVCWRWGVGWASHPRIGAWCRVHFWCILLFFLRRLWLLWFEVFETFELHRVLDFLGTMEQDENVPSKFGAHSKVDNGIVEASRLSKQTGKDAGKVGHWVTIGRPYRDDSIWWPCNNEGSANDNRNLKDRRRIIFNLFWKTTSGSKTLRTVTWTLGWKGKVRITLRVWLIREYGQGNGLLWCSQADLGTTSWILTWWCGREMPHLTEWK